MTIIDHIQYLICRHDCVVVAGLGAFVSQYEPARVSADGSTLLPPKRSLAFNAAISHDDGLLAGSVARRDGVSFEVARERVDWEVETLTGRLDVEGVVDLPRIGRLQKSADSILFTPTAVNPIVNMRYASLPEVTLAAAVDRYFDEEQTVLEVNVGRRSRFANRLLAAGRYAAAVVVLAMLGVTFSTPLIVERDIDHASFAPEVKAPKSANVSSVKPVQVKTYSQRKAETQEVVAPEVKQTEEKKNSVISVADLKDKALPEGYDCYIVIASCSTVAEARRYVAKHGGTNKLRVISGSGRHRVYAAVSNDFDLAYKFKSEDPEFSRKHPTAWVLKN